MQYRWGEQGIIPVKWSLPIAVLLLGLLITSSSFRETETATLSNCPQLPKLFVLPGRGWCSLRNKEMGQVQHFTYEACKTTPDGLFLIPDNAFILPLDESKIQLYAEIIHSWKNYSSLTAKSININADASFGSIASVSGSFSSDYQKCKESQVDQKAVTTRVQARYTMYTVGVSVDDAIDPKLILQLTKVMHAIKLGNEEEVDYLLELVVREYGTHLLTRVDTGGILAQEEYISRIYQQTLSQESEVIKVAASARFFSRYNFGASYSTTANETVKQGYEHNLRSSHTESFGGMLLSPRVNISEWVSSIPAHPIGVDREGDPLHFIVTPSTFPDESLKDVDTLRLELQGAISRYFSYNRHLGCMDVGARNFDYNANIDNNMCKDPYNNYSLGGVYQTCDSVGDGPNGCINKGLSHKNLLTQDFSCPIPYVPVRLMKRTDDSCRECGYRFLFWWVSEQCCSTYTTQTYWCAADETPIGNNTGLMFGGLYTSTMDNPNTQEKNCPPTFIRANMFEDLVICIGNDYELGSRFATNFGGFFSCQIGNPLYDRKELKRLMANRRSGVGEALGLPDLQNETTKACPPGYTQHTAAIPVDCLVSYCVKAGSFSLHGDMPVILPPFQNYTGIFSRVEPIPKTSNVSVWVIVCSVFGAVVLLSVVVIALIMRIKKQRNVATAPGIDNNAGLEDEGRGLLGNEEDDITE